jgi:beta-lactamase class A
MTVAELAAAAAMHSDNTATNLLIQKLGGLNTITNLAHSLGDNHFRLDNWEAELNSNPNKPQDTTTPLAMRESLQKLTLGDALPHKQQQQLLTWMEGNTTGDNLIRAGTPKGWQVGDRTGGGSYGVTNDIAIIWPPKCAPLIAAIYSVGEPSLRKNISK